MRIVCQKCSAAYAIDDKFITPKGVRAQCPRCRHLQLVKKDDAQPAEPTGSPGAAAAPAAASAFLFDLEGPAAPAAAPPPPAPAPPPPSPFATEGANVGTELDFGEFDLGAPPPPSGSQPAPMAMDFSVPDPLDNQPTVPTPMAPPPAPASHTTGVKCRTCSKPLTDPFDQAIGICDECRSKVDSANDPEPEPAAAAAPARPVTHAPAPAAPVPAAAPPAPMVRRSSSAALPSAEYDGGGSKTKLVAIGAVVLLVVGLGAVLGIKKPWQRKPPPLAARLTPGAEKPIDRAVEAWKLRFIDDLSGSSSDHLAAGEEQLAKDTGSGYLEAEEEFQKALVLDKSNDRAIAGYALAMAFGRGNGIEADMAKIAEELLVAAEQRGGAGRVYTAHAHLLLAINGNMNDIKVMAERGKNSPSDRDQALALLALGQSMISKNPQYAAESFSQALKLDPKLKRAYLAQSQLLLTLGRYREAVGHTETRLELEPDQWDAADALARTWIEVGEIARAKKVYQAARTADPRNFRARLALAVLAYQHENDLEGAIGQLDAIVADEDKIEVKDLVEALGHRAAAQRVAGELPASILSAEKAIGLKAQDAHVNLQRFLVAIEQSNASEARAQWPFLTGKLGDKALEGVLEGCLVLLEGKPSDAMKLFAAANEQDKRRIDALLLAGASAIKAKNESKAWEFVLKKGLNGDPRYGGPLPVMARFFVRPQDLLRQAKGTFSALKVEADDPNVPTAEGLIAWYSNDFMGAEKEFARAVAADPGSGHGLAFRALLALRRKENPGGLKLAQKAVQAERQVALAHYAVGMALMSTNQFEAAKAPFRTAFELEPRFTAPQVKLAEIELKQKKPEEARRILTRVLLVDPLYFDAKRALYALP
ncbi:MAG: putative adventurous gliding motility protein [Myxococcaceae bacterium]|nr:putative adventurous gliding motility protein [Myxococcaceae bacterium]